MIIHVENLAHSYGDRVALAGLSFSVERSAAFGILGPNGCGKSTLFRILSTLQRPDSGDASVDGASILGKGSVIRSKLGIVFQSGSLDQKLTVAENLSTQGNLYGLSGKALQLRIDDLLALVRLDDRRTEIAGRLSGGQLRRIEIVKALLHDPAVLLMDEASSGLDPLSRNEMWQTLHNLRAERGVTVLFTTHLMDEAENATRLLLMNEGRVVAEGDPAELKRSVGGDVVILRPVGEGLAGALGSRFNVAAWEIDGEVHVETPAGHRFIAEAVEAFPGQIDAVSMRKPTLEDVFLKLSGAQLEEKTHD